MSAIDWDDLRFLEALCRLGGAASAARELEVSASTVYRRIAALEEALGVPCIVRGEGEATPTELGRSLLAVGARLRRDVARLASRARDESSGMAGLVGLTTTEGFLPLLAEPLSVLIREHPTLEVELQLDDFGPSVRRHEIDVAISVVEDPPPGLVGRRLAPARYGVFGTREAIDTRSGRRSRRWVVTEAPRLGLGAWEQRHAGEVVMRSNSRAATTEMIRRGLGVGLMPRRLAALHTELVEDEAFRDSTEELTHPVWILYHPERRQSVRIQALVAVLVDHLQ